MITFPVTECILMHVVAAGINFVRNLNAQLRHSERVVVFDQYFENVNSFHYHSIVKWVPITETVLDREILKPSRCLGALD